MTGLHIRLNPCFSGTYSRSDYNSCCEKFSRVLILVLVEHTLGEAAIKILWPEVEES